MNIEQIQTLEQMTDFMVSIGSADITPPPKDEAYRWIAHVLRHFRYKSCSKADKGLIQQFLMRVTGYSRQQLNRLIRQFHKTGRLQRQQRTTNGFERIYSPEDVKLLAKIDALHGNPSGPTIRVLCQRAFEVFGDRKYQRLAYISVSHLYNLRKHRLYKNQRITLTKTQSVKDSIGERRKPRPNGKPGYIRVDSVHQGNLARSPGLYHINAVDEVTQFEVIHTVERISEQFMIPALEAILESFPFVVRGFHSDNGSEYINKRVARLLNKLHVELTKSRNRQSNDNALVESKNGTVIRKVLGYVHIPQRFAPAVNQFNEQHLVPYINYHRPCFFPEISVDEKGKQRRRYPLSSMMTPYEKLKSLDEADQYLKPGSTFLRLDKIALAKSDNQAAADLSAARKQLFETIFGEADQTG